MSLPHALIPALPTLRVRMPDIRANGKLPHSGFSSIRRLTSAAENIMPRHTVRRILRAMSGAGATGNHPKCSGA